MDILAHGLWTNAVFYLKYKRDKKQRLLAVLFGVLPDIVSFTPLVIYIIFTGVRFSPGLFQGQHFWPFDYAVQSYNFTHSAIIFALVMLIITIIRKGKAYWPLWGWGFHIAIDIFTHPNFFSTPFLYPLSNYRNYYAIRWTHPVFMLINYALIVIVYVIIFRYRDKHPKLSAET